MPSTQSHGAAGRLTTQESTSLVPKLLAPTLDLAGPGGEGGVCGEQAGHVCGS